MKNIVEKISKRLKKLFGYGIFISLFVGGLTFLGYVVAFIVGGNAAAEICAFVYKKIIPIIIYFSNCMIILGIIAMYLSGEVALTPSKRKK